MFGSLVQPLLVISVILPLVASLMALFLHMQPMSLFALNRCAWYVWGSGQQLLGVDIVRINDLRDQGMEILKL